jgi:hypothetical protein
VQHYAVENLFSISRIKLYKNKQLKNAVFVISNLKSVDITSLDNRAISDFISNVFGVIATSSFGITTTLVNKTSPYKFNQYPYYLLVYYMHFIVPFLISGTISSLYFIRHPPLRKAIHREVLSHWQAWFKCTKNEVSDSSRIQLSNAEETFTNVQGPLKGRRDS